MMIVRGYHGSPNRPFTVFDPTAFGTTSKLGYAKDCFFLSSEPSVAAKYSVPNGFVGRFSLHLENPLEMQDEDRDKSIGALILFARTSGHDGLVLRNCVHSAMSPGMRSDVFIVFEPARAKFESAELDNILK